MTGTFARNVLLATACLLLAAGSRAQDSNLRGRVVDEQGKGLAGVQVGIERLDVAGKYSLTTDEKGSFGQFGLSPGVYRLSFTREGYIPHSFQQELSYGVTRMPRVTLKLAPSGIEGVTALDLMEYQARFDEASALMSAGKLDEAEAIFKDILAEAPAIVEAHGNLAQIYRKKKDWSAAEVELRTVLESRPEAATYLALADVYRRSEQLDELRELLDEVTTSYEDDAQFQLEAGFHYFNLKDLDKAAVAFEKTRHLDPARAETYYYLGALALGRNELPAAIAHLEEYLSLAPPDSANVPQAEQLLKALEASAQASGSQE